VRHSEIASLAAAGLALVAGLLVVPVVRNVDPVLAVCVVHQAGSETDPWGQAWGIPAENSPLAEPGPRLDSFGGNVPGSIGPDGRAGTLDDVSFWALGISERYGSAAAQLLGRRFEITLGLVLFFAWLALSVRVVHAPRGRAAGETARVVALASYPAVFCVFLVAWDAGRMRTVANTLRPVDGLMLAPAELATGGSLVLLCLVAAALVRLRVSEAHEAGAGVDPAPIRELG
jgi:hypothetical protein